MTFESRSARFLFDSTAAVAEALIILLTHARSTRDQYRFYGLNVNAVLQSGLVLEGQIDAVSALLEKVPGTTRYDE